MVEALLIFLFVVFAAMLLVNFKQVRAKAAPCRHVHRTYKFKDFHRGDRGEMYHRFYVECYDCEWKTCMAVPLPDHVTHTLDNDPNFKWYIQ